MIEPTGYGARCDTIGCGATVEHWNIFRLYDKLLTDGWQRGVKLNGELAKRGGKDYCPKHRRPADQAGGTQ